jgi:hypothetical protein
VPTKNENDDDDDDDDDDKRQRAQLALLEKDTPAGDARGVLRGGFAEKGNGMAVKKGEIKGTRDGKVRRGGARRRRRRRR